MPTILLFLLSLALVIFVPGLGINFLATLRIKSIYRFLGKCFGFSHPRRMFRLQLPATGTVNGIGFTVARDRIEDKNVLRVTARRTAVLPHRLMLTGGNDRFIHVSQHGQVMRLPREEFLSINILAGKPVLGRRVTDPLDVLDMVAGGYVIHENGIDLYIPQRSANRRRVKMVIEAVTDLTGRLHAVTAECDLYLAALNAQARRGAWHAEDLECLRRLIKDHRSHPLTEETLQKLVKGRNFESGVLAAKAQGMDLPTYVRTHYNDLDLAGRVSAVEELAERPTPDHVYILHALFHEERSTTVRLALIRAYGKFPDQRSTALCIEALDAKDLEVRRAAIGFLSTHGGKETLPHLYRFFRDTAITRDDAWSILHDTVEEAIQRIRHRLGGEDAGSLSLSEDAGCLSLSEDAGSLSLSEDADSDGLSLSGDD